MGLLKDETGKTYSFLTVLRFDSLAHNRKAKWLCRCVCGRETVVFGDSLRNGHTKSCGCKKQELTLEVRVPLIKHGLSKTSFYKAWQGIIQRCFNKNDNNYKNYGGRGITVCERWLNFDNFKEDMLSSWKRGLSIGRIDNNGNYELNNCRWETLEQQNFNKRNTRLLTIFGVTKPLMAWAKEKGFHHDTILYRIKIRTPEHLLFKPKYDRRSI
jgi:hypothetical protein